MQFNQSQLQMLATLSADMAQVSLASVALPYFLDSYTPALALLGVLVGILFGAVSVAILSSEP